MTTIHIDLNRQLDPITAAALGSHVAVETAWARDQYAPDGEPVALVKAPARWSLVNGEGAIDASPTPDGNALRIRFASGLPEPIELCVLVPDSTEPVELTSLTRVDPDSFAPTAAPDPIWWTAQIDDGTVDPDGHLILTTRGGDVIDAGYVKGAPGGSDAATAEWIETGPETTAALSANYASVVSSAPAARVIVIGDSIENLYSYRSTTSTSVTEQFGGGDWPTWALLLSAGRFQLLRNMGTGGETTTQYLARWDADVAPSLAPTAIDRANTVVIGAAENDIQQPGYTLTATRANILEMVARTRKAGAVPILRTTMPHHLNATTRQRIGSFNQWIRGYCADQGIVLLDFWKLLVDPTTGQYRANSSSDGVHPNELGARAMGQHAADVLATVIPVTPESLPADATDTGLLAPNRLFTTDTSGTPTGWNAIGGTPTGTTRAMVTDPNVPGRMARIAHVGSTGSAVALASTSSAISTTHADPGDILEVNGVLTTDGGVRATVNVAINYNDGVAKNVGRVVYFDKAVTRGHYRFRMPPIPAGFTNVIVTFLTNTGTGRADFAYPSVRNLTREGIL